MRFRRMSQRTESTTDCAREAICSTSIVPAGNVPHLSFCGDGDEPSCGRLLMFKEGRTTFGWSVGCTHVLTTMAHEKHCQRVGVRAEHASISRTTTGAFILHSIAGRTWVRRSAQRRFGAISDKCELFDADEIIFGGAKIADGRRFDQPTPEHAVFHYRVHLSTDELHAPRATRARTRTRGEKKVEGGDSHDDPHHETLEHGTGAGNGSSTGSKLDMSLRRGRRWGMRRRARTLTPPRCW